MSRQVYCSHGIYVTRLAGPAAEAPDRARWQITIPGEYVTLRRDELRRLATELHAASLHRSQRPTPAGDDAGTGHHE